MDETSESEDTARDVAEDALETAEHAEQVANETVEVVQETLGVAVDSPSRDEYHALVERIAALENEHASWRSQVEQAAQETETVEQEPQTVEVELTAQPPQEQTAEKTRRYLFNHPLKTRR